MAIFAHPFPLKNLGGGWNASGAAGGGLPPPPPPGAAQVTLNLSLRSPQRTLDSRNSASSTDSMPVAKPICRRGGGAGYNTSIVGARG